MAKAAGAKPGQLMFPLRVALSGRAHGPDLGEMLTLLGKDALHRARAVRGDALTSALTLNIHAMKQVYTLDDLASRDTLDAGAAKPARLAVLGWPVAHSASPRMHQPALDANGIDARYIRLEVEPGPNPARRLPGCGRWVSSAAT